MKRSFRRIFLFTIVCALFAVICAAFVSAEEVFSLYYYNGDYLKSQIIVSDEEEVTLRDTKYSNRDGTFFGWVSDDGVLYAPGEKVIFTRDTKLYEATGKVANNETQLLQYFKESDWTYIKMGKDMTLTQRLAADSGWQVHVLDLNGHNLTISNCQYGTGATRNGVIFFGKGTINFTSNNTTDGAFYGTAVHGYGDMYDNLPLSKQRLWIGKDVKIVTNVPLMRVENDASWFADGSPTLNIWGDVTCTYLVRSHGLNSADINIYPSAKVSITSGEFPLIRDTSSYDDIMIADLNFYGGKITLPEEFGGWVPAGRDRCFTMEIAGGTFNIDIAKYISVDFKTIKNADGTFSVEPNICPDSPNQKHKYLATDITVTCTEDGTVTYKCDYCKASYVSERFALGHNVITLKTSDMSIGSPTKAATPGVYTNTCARCNSVETEYFYPDPSTVYVEVKVRYERDGEKKVDSFRVVASKLFGFSIDADSDLETNTYLTSYGFTKLEHTFSDGRKETFKINEVVGVEIPLGTTKIYGGRLNNAYIGLFYRNEDIEQISIPLSVETVLDAAFADMPNLTTVTGVENISKSIGAYAFGQNKDHAHLVFDTLELNARTISDSAFKNILAKRIIIGTDVKTLQNAFQMDSNIQQIEKDYENGKGYLKEIFVEDFNERFNPEDNPTFYNRSLSTIWASLPAAVQSSMFATLNTGSALLTKANVFYDHKYDTVVHAPTCLEQGYTAYECIQCGLATKSDFVSNEGITHIWERSPKKDVASTCIKEGYTTETCTICQSVNVLQTLPRNDKHSWGEPEADYDACTKVDYHTRRRCTDCGAWSKNIVSTPLPLDKPMGHTFASGDDSEVVTIPATCGTPGQSIKTCARCYEQDIVETEPTGIHHMQRNDSQRVAPTCAAPGYNYFYCKNCDATETKTISQLSFEEAKEANAHVWKDVVIVEPTKKAEGMKKRICSLCAQGDGDIIFMPRLPKDSGLPLWAWIAIIGGGALFVTGIVLTIYFTLFKKNNASKNYKYKFNTLRK